MKLSQDGYPLPLLCSVPPVLVDLARPLDAVAAGEPLFYDHTAPGAADTMITEDDDEVGVGGGVLLFRVPP